MIWLISTEVINNVHINFIMYNNILVLEIKLVRILYCRLRVWHNLLIKIINNQDLWDNCSMVILDARHMLTEKTWRYLIEPKSLIRRNFNLINGYVCDYKIWLTNMAFKNRNYIWIWIFLYKIPFLSISHYIIRQKLEIVLLHGIISYIKDKRNN